jgi:hypothetical protein
MQSRPAGRAEDADVQSFDLSVFDLKNVKKLTTGTVLLLAGLSALA